MSGTKKSIFLIGAVVLILIIASWMILYSTGRISYAHKMQEKQKTEVQYHCPMHPNYISDKPGDCPICGMKLVPFEPEDQTAHGDDKAQKSQKVPAAHESMEMIEEKAESQLPEGRVAVSITPEKRQLLGIVTAEVRTIPMEKSIRMVGTIEADETRFSHVHTKIKGWIEKVFADFTGKLVSKGDPLVTIYSPELVSTQEEYLLALESEKKLASSPFTDVASGGEKLLEAAQRRLELWDIHGSEIEELKESGKIKKSLTLYSPVQGFILSKQALEGMYVEPGMELYSIADLTEVWVIADVYEYELPFIKLGQKAILTLSYSSNENFPGEVDYIYPFLDEKTRTAKVRFKCTNADFRLKPGMYANIELNIDLGKGLAVPADAVLDSGTQQIVFVDLKDGRLEPRDVVPGIKTGGFIEIKDGLKEGEFVVTQANFLIDSESKLKAALSAVRHQH